MSFSTKNTKCAAININALQPFEYVAQISDSIRGKTGEKASGFNCKGTVR